MSDVSPFEKLLGTQLEEDRLRVRSLQLLVGDGSTNQTLELIEVEVCLDLMIRAASVPQPTEDGNTVSAVVARIFNTTTGCLRQALSGYYQNSFGLMRDLVEIGTLLDYFSVYRGKISRWRSVTNVERLQEFRPGHMPKILDESDGFVDAQDLRRPFTTQLVRGSRNAMLTRHSLTCAVELLPGASVEDVATILGNTPQVVTKHYAPWVKERQVRLEKLVKESWAQLEH